jgi:hypothetical protein
MIHGHYYLGKKRVACRNAYCTTCHAARFAEGRRSLVILHLNFVPILPIGTIVRWFCSACKGEVDAHRPSRPWILIAGIFFGLLITFVAVMTLIEGKEKEPPWGGLLLGPLIVVGLGYMIGRQDYKGYLAGQQTVTPLKGDRCPYCGLPLVAAKTPRCRACKIKIITK